VGVTKGGLDPVRIASTAVPDVTGRFEVPRAGSAASTTRPPTAASIPSGDLHPQRELPQCSDGDPGMTQIVVWPGRGLAGVGWQGF
jgi:hypothetical protein